MDFLHYAFAHRGQIYQLLIEHIELTALALFFAIAIGIPLGILICYVKKLDQPILGTASIIQAIPSMALLGFAIPFLGIGTLPAVVTVILYSLLPIIKNTYTGIHSIEPQTVEAAKGIGLTRMQVLFKVQIPLALPIIMSGVRIAAVTAVGLMTIAAFIGAGGLGYLVFSGIRTVNTMQILAGAVPACLLALFVDYIGSLVEKLVTPLSLQKSAAVSVSSLKKQRVFYKGILVSVTLVLLAMFAGTSFTGIAAGKKDITIGTKDFTEQLILGNMAADMIEGNTDIKVERKINLGGTQVCFSALKAGDIDMYIDYTGTIYADILGNKPISDVKKVYESSQQQLAAQYNIEALEQLGFNNTYAIGVLPKTAEKYHLETISDLAAVAQQLKAGTTLEFLNREDGLVGLKKKYGFILAGEVGLDGSPRYTALLNGEVDAIDAFSTDGLVKKFDLKLLKDDKNFFPPYYAVPLINEAALKKYPQLRPLMSRLGNVLSNDTMAELNYKVDELKMDPAEVAHQFLIDQKLIET